MRAWIASRRWAGRLIITGVSLTLALALLIGGANAYVLLTESGRSSSDLARVPDAEVALVLGAFVEPDGKMSQMLADRVQGALALWRAGKVQRILVSGDHHTWAYDEPDTMRRALQRDGVPGRDIFTDHDGLDTWASMVRARRVFGVHTATVVTQGFHMPRALYLASQAGLSAHGYTTDLHGYGRQGQISGVREVLARVKAVYQGVADPSVQLGPHIAISGERQDQLGPAAPAGSGLSLRRAEARWRSERGRSARAPLLIAVAQKRDRVGVAADDPLEEDLAVLVGRKCALGPAADLVEHHGQARIGLAELAFDLALHPLGQRRRGARRWRSRSPAARSARSPAG